MRPQAHHYDQVNDFYPFREGNGCTQWFFFDQVAAAGWLLDWTQVTGAIDDEAPWAAAGYRNFTALHQMFAKILTPAPRRT